MQPIIIIGTGNRGKAALEILQSNKMIVYGFLDEDNSREGDYIGDVSILGSQEDPIFLGMLGEKCAVFAALEDVKQQQNYIEKWIQDKDIPTVNAIHPQAYLSGQVTLGEGNLIHVYCSVGNDVIIGSYNTLEEQIVVRREVQIGDHVHIKSGTIIGEGAIIGSGAQIGSGVIIMSQVTIQENAVIPTGTIVK